jgi:hypothetical protein
MNTDDKLNILKLRQETGCPLPLVKDTYLKHTADGVSNMEKIKEELKAERKNIFNKIMQRETDKTVFICKQDEKIVRILKCKMQTDYLPRTQEMQEIFYNILNNEAQDTKQIEDSYERLVVLANEKFSYQLFVIEYDHLALCSFQKGMWSDLMIKGLTTAESLIIIKYNEEKPEYTNMVASKLFKYVQGTESKQKVELNEENLEKIFDEKIIGKFHEVKLTDYEVFFS